MAGGRMRRVRIRADRTRQCNRRAAAVAKLDSTATTNAKSILEVASYHTVVASGGAAAHNLGRRGARGGSANGGRRNAAVVATTAALALALRLVDVGSCELTGGVALLTAATAPLPKLFGATRRRC